MPTLKDPKRERFAQLVASGIAAQAAYVQAGYIAPQNSPRLRNDPLVAKRIEELQARNERKAEAIALKRDELVEILTRIVKATATRLEDARLADGLKAAEMLTKMCGWNEPEKPQEHQHMHLHVNADLMDQLRAGHARMSAREQKLELLAGSVSRPASEMQLPKPED